MYPKHWDTVFKRYIYDSVSEIDPCMQYSILKCVLNGIRKDTRQKSRLHFTAWLYYLLVIKDSTWRLINEGMLLRVALWQLQAPTTLSLEARSHIRFALEVVRDRKTFPIAFPIT